MQFSKVSSSDRVPVDLSWVERMTTAILREIELEKGRVRAHRDTVTALQQRIGKAKLVLR